MTMMLFHSAVIICYFLCLVTARKYALEDTVEEVLRETVKINSTFLTDVRIVERQNIVFGKQTEKEPFPFATGLVSYDCLRCICMVESGCKPIGCKMDVGSLSCGFFQIKEGYWTDCGKLGGDWKTCADDIKCASQCVQNYMKRYAMHYGCPATCEGYAREHNGGPKGCKNPKTIVYWNEVQKCLNA